MSLTITANLVDLTNTANVGKAIFTLLLPVANSQVTVSGAVISQLSVTSLANGSGAISQVILGNDVLTPAGTTYLVSVYAATGVLVWEARYKLTGTGSVDLSTLTPLAG